MNSALTEAVQVSIRPGEMADTYYYGDTNVEKQAYPCVENNRFQQTFQNLGQGTSQFVISANQGMSDMVVRMRMPTSIPNDCSGTAFNEGWAYSLIRQVSVRYGSSAQYFFTGDQVLLEALHDCENGSKRDQLIALGGNAITGVEVEGALGYVYLKLPHNSPRAQGKPLPFPTDLLVQPVVITIELRALRDIAVPVAGAGSPADLTGLQLAEATLQVKQEMMEDSADLLARRVDMNTHAYTFPLPYFPQQQVDIRCAGGGAQSVNLTGFRAGEVQKILLWLNKASDLSGNGLNYAPWNFQPITDIQLTYNGEIFFRADALASQIWSLVEQEKEAAVNTQVWTAGGSGSVATGLDSPLATWVEIPFAQTNPGYDRESKLVHGKPILNAVVNLQFTCPDASDYVLHAVYLYNASVLCSRGSAEYIF